MTDAKTVLERANRYWERAMRRRRPTVYRPTASDLALLELRKCIDALAASQARVEALDDTLGRAFAVYPYEDESGKKVITLGAFAELQALRPSRQAALAAAGEVKHE